MDPAPTMDAEISLADWQSDEKIKSEFASMLRDPRMRTAIALWKERFRCVHSTDRPTIIEGLDPIQSAAALNHFREGANHAIDYFLGMGKAKRSNGPVTTNDPRHFGDYQLQAEPASPPNK